MLLYKAHSKGGTTLHTSSLQRIPQSTRPLSRLQHELSRRRVCAIQRLAQRVFLKAYASSQHHDDCAHVFGEKGHIAGIPTCAKCTPTGLRLRYALRHRPHEFVSVVLQELREVVSMTDLSQGQEPSREESDSRADPGPGSHLQASLVGHYPISRRPGATFPTPGGHYDAEARSAKEDQSARPDPGTHYNLARDGERGQTTPGPLPGTHYDSRGVGCGDDAGEASTLPRGMSEALQDIMYFWALAEAYLQGPQIQADMRRVLDRQGTGPLAAGDDKLELRSRVQLMDGPFFEGQYMIGSVNFVKAPEPAEDVSSPNGTGLWGDGDIKLEDLPRPSLDGVFGSDKGKLLMALEGDNPTRMMRKGAARSYHMYLNWGYFQRRMALNREQDGGGAGPSRTDRPAFGMEDRTASPGSFYGSPANNVWRYFENVPDQLSSLRTKEAAAVADRHLRALFGDAEECITTIQSWQQMTHEAKWVGRALYDAEDIVLRALYPGIAVPLPTS